VQEGVPGPLQGGAPGARAEVVSPVLGIPSTGYTSRNKERSSFIFDDFDDESEDESSAKVILSLAFLRFYY